MRRCAIEVLENERFDGVHAVVDACGHDEDGERILVWRVETELRGRPEEEGADIHRRAGGMRRDELSVQRDSQINAIKEVLLRDRRHGDELGRALHAKGVLVGPEDSDGAVVLAEGFHALVALHAVVEAGGHAVDREVGRGDEAGWGPC